MGFASSTGVTIDPGQGYGFSGVIVDDDGELFPDYVEGRSWTWSESPSDFTLSNFTETTDSGSPALVLTTPASVGTVLTDATDIPGCRVAVKFRAQPGSGLNITDITLSAVGRYQDTNNHYRARRQFASGNSRLSPQELVAGGTADGGALAGDTAMDNTDSTTYQWLVMDVFADVVRAKNWFVDEAEPDWKGYPLRFQPAYGFGGSSTTSTNDNITETGAAGVRAQFGGTIQDIVVTELLRETDNVIFNSRLDPELVTSGGKPFFWAHDAALTSETTGICELVTDEIGPSGQVEPLLRAARGSSASGSPMWEQAFYLTGAADNASYTRDRPIPTFGSEVPALLSWSIWTKGTNVANTNPGGMPLSARWVNYYIDGAGGLLMDDGPPGTGQDYHYAIGPNNGVGTWDWTEFTGVLPVYANDDAVQLRMSIGLHDAEATGELLMAEPVFEVLTVPYNTAAPVISGIAETGETLSCSDGTWLNSPTFTYQWKRNGTNIGGATASTYVLQVADEGTSIKCTVTATNGSGTDSEDSNTVTPTAPVVNDFPSSITGLAFRLKANDETYADGDPVGTATDLSGNSRNATASTTARPTFKTGIVNGRSVYRFDGSSDILAFANNAFSGVTTAATLFIALKVDNDPPAAATPTGIGRFGTSGQNSHYPYTDSNVYNDFAANSRKTVGNPTPSLASWHVLEIVSAFNDWRIYINGTQIFSTTSNTFALNANCALGGDGTYFLDGDIAEAFMYQGAKDSTDRAALRTYLGVEYGITVA